jgi:glycosyltransferase involved in cell wall biosynthesis
MPIPRSAPFIDLSTMDLSIVVPLYNEADSVTPLYRGIKDALAPLGLRHEILFVDDGSRDQTFEVASRLAVADPLLRVIRFRKNYGQTPAMVAGIEHAGGEVIITMDGDLQNDPRDIPLFLEKVREGFDIVVGWRYERQDKLMTRKIPSVVANWMIGRVTRVPIKDNGCSLKAYRAAIIKSIPLYSEMHRFIPAMASLAGTRIAEIKVNHHARQFGQSKYGLSRMYKVLLDLVTVKAILAYLSRPLYAFAMVAGIGALVALLALGASVVDMLLHPDAGQVVFTGLALLYGALAIVLLSWGVLAELIYHTGTQKLEGFARLKVDAPTPERRTS